MTIGKRISEARKTKGYTQEYIAEQLGVSRQAVSKWEQDQTSPDTRNLIGLSKLLGVTVDYLAVGSVTDDDPTENANRDREKLIKSYYFLADILPLIGGLGSFILALFRIYDGALLFYIGSFVLGFLVNNQGRKLDREHPADK